MNRFHSWYHESGVPSNLMVEDLSLTQGDTFGVVSLAYARMPSQRILFTRATLDTLICLTQDALTRWMVTFGVPHAEKMWNQDELLSEAFSLYFDMTSIRNSMLGERAEQAPFLEEVLYQRAQDEERGVVRQQIRAFLPLRNAFLPTRDLIFRASRTSRKLWAPLNAALGNPSRERERPDGEDGPSRKRRAGPAP